MKFSIKKTSSLYAVISVLLLGVSHAAAADLEAIEPAPAPAAAPSTYDWSGPYFGVQFGGAVDGDNTLALGPLSTTENLDGILGGVLGGYNFQKGNFVFGLDSDFSFSSIDSSLGPVSLDIDTLSTTRLRVGYAYNRLLPYVTGGLAYGSVDLDSGVLGFGSEDEIHVGWTAGAGIEYAINDRIHARLQYNYVDLGEENFNFGGGVVARAELDNIHLIRAGISIKTGFIFDKIFGRK